MRPNYIHHITPIFFYVVVLKVWILVVICLCVRPDSKGIVTGGNDSRIEVEEIKKINTERGRKHLYQIGTV